MWTSNRAFSSTFSAIALLAFTAFGCSSGDDPRPTEKTDTVEQALGGTCPGLCSSSASCSQSCTVDSAQGQQTITCGQYGLCKPSTTTSSSTTTTTGGGSPSCPAGQRCIEYGHDGQGNVICVRCGKINGL